MQNITRATLAAIGLLPFSLFANDSSLSSTDVINDTRLVLEWQQGKKAGGFLDAMVPFYGDNSQIFFTDVQAYKYGDQYETVGIGLGHRGIVKNAIFGVYGFYDYQKSETNKTYGRLSFGIERLTETWDVLANFNYYIFEDKNDLVKQNIVSGGTEGHNVFYIYNYDTEKVYSGANFEVGRSLGTPHLRGYLGAYTYGGKINGTSARLQYQINQNITFTASTQHDSTRGWLTTAGIQYWIGKGSSYGDDFNLADRLRDPIMRDMTVTAKLDFAHTEKEYDSRKIYFASPNVTLGEAQAGTAADPTSYADALSKAGANDFVYLTKGDGTAYTLGNTTIGGQTLWGAGANLSSRGVVIVAGASANQPSLTGTTINVTGAGTVGGFSLVGVAGRDYGINISHSAGTATVQDVTMTGTFDEAAINVTSSADALIKNSTINATSAVNGIKIANTGGTITVDGSTLTGTYSKAGISVNGSNALAAVNNTTITNNTVDAMRLFNGANATLTDSTLDGGSSGYGLYVDASTITSTGSRFKNSGTSGVYIVNGAQATLTNAIITGNGTKGLNANGATTSVTVNGDSTTISGNGSDAVYASDNATVAITGGNIISSALDASVEAVQAITNASVTITNPNTLQGEINVVDTSTITITSGGTTYTGDQANCNITNGSGSCTP